MPGAKKLTKSVPLNVRRRAGSSELNDSHYRNFYIKYR